METVTPNLAIDRGRSAKNGRRLKDGRRGSSVDRQVVKSVEGRLARLWGLLKDLIEQPPATRSRPRHYGSAGSLAARPSSSEAPQAKQRRFMRIVRDENAPPPEMLSESPYTLSRYSQNFLADHYAEQKPYELQTELQSILKKSTSDISGNSPTDSNEMKKSPTISNSSDMMKNYMTMGNFDSSESLPKMGNSEIPEDDTMPVTINFNTSSEFPERESCSSLEDESKLVLSSQNHEAGSFGQTGSIGQALVEVGGQAALSGIAGWSCPAELSGQGGSGLDVRGSTEDQAVEELEEEEEVKKASFLEEVEVLEYNKKDKVSEIPTQSAQRVPLRDAEDDEASQGNDTDNDDDDDDGEADGDSSCGRGRVRHQSGWIPRAKSTSPTCTELSSSSADLHGKHDDDNYDDKGALDDEKHDDHNIASDDNEVNDAIEHVGDEIGVLDTCTTIDEGDVKPPDASIPSGTATVVHSDCGLGLCCNMLTESRM